MKQVLIRQGRAMVEEVPAPVVEPGTVLVAVDHSCISVGTEMSGVRASGLPLWKRALQQPEKVARVVRMAASEGVARTRRAVEGQISTPAPTGYSAAGVVLEVGEGIDDLRPGDRVACAGAQFAHHAGVIRVPRNLVAPVPDGLDLAAASTVTLGAIALQGVRRATPTLGETFVVVGLGILGQLTAQLLRANGCRVVGTDLDRGRIAVAVSMGMDVGLHPDDGEETEQVARLTDGIGADGVIVTAAAPSDAILSTAFRMCRRKGRVVLVGDVGLKLDRADFYAKELDFLVSTSYGPGRYDRNYEERGLDYPVGYVRWTENRNLAEYLRLLADGRVSVAPLVSRVFPVQEAEAAYAALEGGDDRPLMVLLSYPREAEPVRRVANPRARGGGAGKVRVALVGAGAFAKGMHLPNLQALADRYHLRAVVSRTGHNAAAAAAQFGAEYATTELDEVLRDPEVDAVIVATRHNLHAPMVLRALEAGKHVLVEKPLALVEPELEEVEAFYERAEARGGPAPVLLTGFNRRFSPFARRALEIVRERSNPMIVSYRMNAGHVPRDSWLHDEEGGGRNLGEACHVYDLFTFLTGSRVADVTARAIVPRTGHYLASDNFVATLTFEDGSVATLTYTALGSREHPKEQMEVFVDGKVLVLDDYRRLTVAGAKAAGVETRAQDKGQKAELEAFARALREGGEWPIALWEQVQTTEIGFEVERHLRPYLARASAPAEAAP
ncbi:MAG TPA: bi-domain-containing oxidoreductase [Longimicrobiaceae bacterium]